MKKAKETDDGEVDVDVDLSAQEDTETQEDAEDVETQGDSPRIDLAGAAAEERKIAELINTLAQHIRVAMKGGGVNLVTVAIVGNHPGNGKVFEVTPKADADDQVRESMLATARLSSAMLLKGHLGRIVKSIETLIRGVLH